MTETNKQGGAGNPLNKPIVADVIRLLETYPQDALFCMVDSDTYWTINIIHHELREGKVEFFGCYEEMERG